MQNVENCEYSVIISCCGTTGHKNNINNGQFRLKGTWHYKSILRVTKLDFVQAVACGLLFPWH